MGDRAATAAKNKIMKEDKLHRQGGSGSQKRRKTSLKDKAATAAKNGILEENKLGRQGGNGS